MKFFYWGFIFNTKTKGKFLRDDAGHEDDCLKFMYNINEWFMCTLVNDHQENCWCTLYIYIVSSLPRNISLVLFHVYNLHLLVIILIWYNFIMIHYCSMIIKKEERTWEVKISFFSTTIYNSFVFLIYIYIYQTCNFYTR